MDRYTISIIGSVEWQVGPMTVTQLLYQLWPTAEVITMQPGEEQLHQLGWTIILNPTLADTSDSPLLVAWLDQRGQDISLWGDFEPVIDFTLFYRHLVPVGSRIRFADSPHHVHADIDESTSKQQLLRMFVPTLTPVEWSILHALETADGLTTIGLLLQTVLCDHRVAGVDDLRTDLGRAIHTLWQMELVSSPSMRWVSNRPDAIATRVSETGWHTFQLSLTSSGKRALLAQIRSQEES